MDRAPHNQDCARGHWLAIAACHATNHASISAGQDRPHPRASLLITRLKRLSEPGNAEPFGSETARSYPCIGPWNRRPGAGATHITS